jgi:hypothetical protein
MDNKFIRGYHKPTKFTAENYGTKISVEIDHSDLSLDEVMDAFQTLIIGMGYHENSFKNWVIERAEEYNETDAENLKEQLNESDFEDEDYEGQFDEWDNETPIDEDIELNGHVWNDEDDVIVGASDEEGIDWDCSKYDGEGNLWESDEDEERYSATEEDEDEFSNDGGFDGKPHFEWDKTTEEDEDLFEGEAWTISQKLIEANERYKGEVKKMNTKKKKDKK